MAHVLSWSDYPEYRAELGNVLPLSKTHHAAFDRGLFTLDTEYGVRVNPSFETASDLLQRTLIEQAGARVQIPDGMVDPKFIDQHNASIDWM